MAGFNAQSKALFRKSAAYQRKNWGTNLCLLLSPIVFTLLLFLLQTAIDNAIDTPDNRCGCKCLRCCTTNDSGREVCTGDCPPLPSSYDKCEEYDENVCGIEYSNADQVGFCPVKNPPIWPPIQQVPRPQYRAENTDDVTFLYTGNSKSIADELSSYLFNPRYNFSVSLDNLLASFGANGSSIPPDLSISTLLQLSQFLRTPNDNLTQTFDSYIDAFAEQIDFSNAAQAGFILGSSTETVLGGAYLEPAFFPVDDEDRGQPVYIIARNCSVSVQEIASSFDQPMQEVQFLLESVGVEVNQGFVDIGDLVNNPNTTWLLSGQISPLNNIVQYKCVDSDVNYIETQEEINAKLFCGFKQARCNGLSEINEYSAAFDWRDTNDENLNVEIWHNDTNEVGGDGGGGPPTLQRYSEDMNQVANAWVHWLTQGVLDRTEIGTQVIGLRDMPTKGFELRLELSSILGTLLYLWLIQLIVPVMLYQLVYEKEKRLRMMMKMHGLGETVYWLVNYVWFLTLYCAYIIVLLIFGSLPMLDLSFFRINDYLIQIIYYFLYGNCQIAFVFLITCFFTSAKTAVIAGLLWVLASSLIASVILAQFYATDRWYVVLLELVPQFGAYRGLYEFSTYSILGSYKDSDGMLFENLTDEDNGMLRVWIYFIVEWAIFMLLAWYLQQVLDSGTGIRKPPLFFLEYFRSSKNKVTIDFTSTRSSRHSEVDEQNIVYDDLKEDVLREKQRVERMSTAELQASAIVVNNLQKIFPAIDGNPAKVAVRSLTLAVDKGEVFGLLGPNGAGKSTSINMMTGLLEPSRGTAVVAGKDISREMNQIYQDMGVCPQHDLLWENLTGREHLFFYARLKGLNDYQELNNAVNVALQSVNLLSDGNKKVKSYSGGMKRRLSVAISLIGNPTVVYMDEPSTGLDPASRRLLWDVVKSRKENHAIILTTHSMEEAEVLCDRLGIFVDGRLVCIGNPKQITGRYAGYLVFTIMVPSQQEQQARTIVGQMSPGAELTYSLGGLMKFELPTSEVTLSQVFATMEIAKGKLQILDWAVTSATLEEVFIKLARQVEATSGEMQH